MSKKGKAKGCTYNPRQALQTDLNGLKKETAVMKQRKGTLGYNRSFVDSHTSTWKFRGRSAQVKSQVLILPIGR